MSNLNTTYTKHYNTVRQPVLDAEKPNRIDSNTRIISVYCTPRAIGNYQFLNAETGEAVVLSPNDVIIGGCFKGNGMVGAATTYQIGMALTASGAVVSNLANTAVIGTSTTTMNTGGIIGIPAIVSVGAILVASSVTASVNRFLALTTAVGAATAGTVEGVLIIHQYSSASTV